MTPMQVRSVPGIIGVFHRGRLSEWPSLLLVLLLLLCWGRDVICWSNRPSGSDVSLLVDAREIDSGRLFVVDETE
jgi:hypothetical protein